MPTMKIDCTVNNSTREKEFSASFFERIWRPAARAAGLRVPACEFSVNFVGMARIRTLNKKYRGKDKATDVLSFPLTDFVHHGAMVGSSAILSLGDIFICIQVARVRARREKVRVADEIMFLAVHGFLHLLGFDHEGSAQQSARMFRIQDTILRSLHAPSHYLRN